MVDLILNRHARHLAGDGPVRRALLDAARDVGADVHETTELSELETAARTIAARGSTSVILAGGDGSYMAGVTALVRAFGEKDLPPIALAPGGTVGTVARNWGGGRWGWGAAGAGRIVRGVARHEGSAIRRPTLHVTDDRGTDHVGFMLGAGLVAGFFDEYYAGATLGYVGAAKIAAQVFAQSFVGGQLAKRVLDPVAATLTVDGREADAKKWSLVLASVIRDVGLHILVTPHAGDTLGAFHLVASPLGPRALGPQLPLVLAGKRLRGRGHVDAPAARDLVLRFESVGTYVLDGDVVRADEVRVRAGPVISVLSG
ncbi:MAG: diacylglycerol kinase family protein [Polyangiaceae bacterium]|jgi:diacylglycerol kinase (ATP)